MAAVVALMAKDKNGPALKAQVLLWPVTDASFETTSYHDYAEERFLTRNMMIWFWDNYTTDAKARKEIYASPLQAGPDQLKGLPPHWYKQRRTMYCVMKVKHMPVSWMKQVLPLPLPVTRA